MGALALGAVACNPQRRFREAETMLLITFGDSILDCGRYNSFGLNPGQLIVQNDDERFPEFRGQDLSSRGPARLEHRARDGATVRGLAWQVEGLGIDDQAVALVTVGGNDLLGGLISDNGPGIEAFTRAFDDWLRALPIRPVLIGNVYDPTFGDDRNNFLGVDPALARTNHRNMNDKIAQLASRYGSLVDLHAHFLTGDPSWYTNIIEPSLRGASEVRRAFLAHLLSSS
jgi:acyl-CoA thioesterase I